MAQLDSAPDSDSGGCGSDSRWAYQKNDCSRSFLMHTRVRYNRQNTKNFLYYVSQVQALLGIP